MSVLRVFAFLATVGLSTTAVALVSADRLAQSVIAPNLVRQSVAVEPTRRVARAPVVEPTATGTVRQDSEGPKAMPTRAPNGFDSERLNALLREASLATPRKR